MSNTLTLKTINELRDINFYIPSYQRGYRWSPKEVKDLLNDVNEFRPKFIDEDSDYKTWYCLQPIVVAKKGDGAFEVIDGQQRLTTIFLITKFLSSRFVEPEKTFSLSYETRENSSAFLNDLKKREIVDTNIDFFHISKAYEAICDWFDNPNLNVNDFESKFKFQSKVIWYEGENQDPISVFTRINIGKIPLTNSELIKALFLNSSNFDKRKSDRIRLKQLEISTEWDGIEHTLQDDRFWFFLNGKDNSTNRIEFIFDLMNDEKDIYDNYSTFRFFNKKFKKNNQETIEENWKEIKRYFQRFQEWFEERDLYHKIGYLVTVDALNIKEIYDKSTSLTKKEFRNLLDGEIKNYLKNVSLENLQYGDKKVKSVLLLYNVLTMLKNENDNSYFPFDIFKKEKWDIEHITSVAEAIPSKKLEWLKDAGVFIDNTTQDGVGLKQEIDDFDSDSDEDFEELFSRIVSHFNYHLKDNDINDISNLSLLDSETNRGYKNAVFPIKRKTIIEREKNGTFVPICTKNVFLKYFSSYPPKISFWTQEDRDNYYADLEAVLGDYIVKRDV